MAKFLTTVGNSFYIEQIILNAEENLTLVTPYLSLSKNLMDRLTDADKSNIKMTLIYGKNELSYQEQSKIKSLKNIEIYFCENLHAKCYLNEHSMIITSMNLYEFSERNNREMGILIEKAIDEQIFNDTLKEIESIKNASKKEQSPTGKKKVVRRIDSNNTSQSRQEEDLSSLVYLTSKKSEEYNFHYPSLYRVLKAQAKKSEVYYDKKEDTIEINDYPVEDVQLVVDGRIDFNFDDDEFFYYLKKNYKEKIREASPKGIRFYWNHFCINIYLEKNFEASVDQKGLEEIVAKFSGIIQNTTKEISSAYKEHSKLIV